MPRTDAVLGDPRVAAAAGHLGRSKLKATVVEVLAEVRSGTLAPDDVIDAVVRRLPRHATSMRRVINATGVVLHTNLGRAQLSAAARDAIAVAAGAVDVEYDLLTGRRAPRGRGALAALRRAVPLAEAAFAVNNGAAALVLATTAFAAGRDVVVSRGEMVEIGDGFRLPDLIESTGARLREVGTTNRTTLADYEAALGANTGCILKVHPSNFRVEGFTSSVPVRALSGLGAPLVVDVGSGLLRADPLLPDEPDVSSALDAGASVVTASGDKLFGGPQAGLVFGSAEAVEKLRRHPLARALRVDKLTLAALEATLDGPASPTDQAIHADPAAIRERCFRIVTLLPDEINARVVPSAGAVGGGGAPGLELAGWAIAVPASLAPLLRTGDPAVVARVEHDRCLLDLRCVAVEDDANLARAVHEAVAASRQTAGQTAET